METEDILTRKTKGNLYSAMKRGFDVLVSFIALIVLSPLILLIGLSVILTSKGPAFFCHRRIGLNNKEFFLYKFRTMVQDADRQRCNFTADQIAEFQTNYKLKNDPRVTTLGNFLRKSSLDELPQLINILKGEMSLVGPRPVVRDEISKYGKYADLLVSVPPGLTGLWQVNGRNNTTYEERVMLDVQYIRQRCFLLDLKIFFKTFREVFLRMGAF